MTGERVVPESNQKAFNCKSHSKDTDDNDLPTPPAHCVLRVSVCDKVPHTRNFQLIPTRDDVYIRSQLSGPHTYSRDEVLT